MPEDKQSKEGFFEKHAVSLITVGTLVALTSVTLIYKGHTAKQQLTYQTFLLDQHKSYANFLEKSLEGLADRASEVAPKK